MKAVNDIAYKQVKGHGTNTPAALDLMRVAGKNGSLGLRDGFINLGVLITDGNPRLSFQRVSAGVMKDRTRRASKELHGSNIYNEIYAVGIGKIDSEVLTSIASSTDNILRADRFSESRIDELRKILIRELCTGE